MGRIVIPGAGVLDPFRTALNSLADAGIDARPGTKLLTRYAVIVVDDAQLDEAIGQLKKAGIQGQKDAS